MNQVPKESIIKLSAFINKGLVIHFNGGRKIKGTLKSFDHNLNVILDDCIEYLRGKLGLIVDSTDPYTYNEGKTRPIGLVICRGTMVSSFMSADGYV